MRRPVTARDRFRYRFDTFMSRGPIALVGALGLASLLVILVGAALVHGLGVAPADAEGHRPGFVTLIWMAGMRAMDAGAVGGDDGSRLYLALMLAVTLGGIFVVSALIGVLTSGLGAKLNNLHKGRSRVIEDGHTLILGWSAQVFTVVSELDKYAVAGSELTIIADDETPGRDLDALEADLVNHKVTLVQGDINDRRVLDEARVSGFQHVITLSYADRFGVQQATR